MIESIRLMFCLLLLAPWVNQGNTTGLSEEEMDLYEQIMSYRKSKGLKSIALSESLTLVAQTHCEDLVENKPDLAPTCNAHSWSDKGDWTSCCYTSDHKAASCMWNKPSELTSYTGLGFEIAVGSSAPEFDDYIMTADYALGAWKKSKDHNNMIVNEDIWKDIHWKAIGVSIHKGYSTVWFGREADVSGK